MFVWFITFGVAGQRDDEFNTDNSHFFLKSRRRQDGMLIHLLMCGSAVGTKVGKRKENNKKGK